MFDRAQKLSRNSVGQALPLTSPPAEAAVPLQSAACYAIHPWAWGHTVAFGFWVCLWFLRQVTSEQGPQWRGGVSRRYSAQLRLLDSCRLQL